MKNKAHLAQIEKLQVYLSISYNARDKGFSTQSLLKDGEGTIQLLKKKLEIPSTWPIQTVELTKIEKERETLNTELVNCKSKLLIQEVKEVQWKKDDELWAEEKRAFEIRQHELEKELKELKEKAQEQPTPLTQSPEVPDASEVIESNASYKHFTGIPMCFQIAVCDFVFLCACYFQCFFTLCLCSCCRLSV